MRNLVFVERFGDLDDTTWLGLLVRSLTSLTLEDVSFPGFPGSTMQSSFVGSSGEETLVEASQFYVEVKGFAKRLGVEINTTTRALDFGCGWARHYRFFLRHLSTDNFVGIDIDPECVKVCRETVPMGTFESCDIMPPSKLKAGTFDLIYAYSVFSHLNEQPQLRWAEEFDRLLRPGGIAVVSTLKRAHIAVWDDLLRDGNEHYKRALTQAGFDSSRAQDAFEEGKFLYSPVGGGGIRESSFYGEAIVSPDHVRKNWPASLELMDYVDSPERGPQALIVVQKTK